MTALAASDFTVVVEKRLIEGLRKRNRVKLTFGDGSKTYSTGGIPMPAKTAYGLVRELEWLNIIDSSFDGKFWKYDKTNNKLKLFIEATVATNTDMAEASAAEAPANNTVVYVEAVGW